MTNQLPIGGEARADDPARDRQRHDHTHEIAPDLAYRRLAMVNVVFYGRPGAGAGQWVLIDAGVPGSRHFVEQAASSRFGQDAPPAAIVMTHGHFDHVGALEELAEKWNVPVYAHVLEHPYLSGSVSYPPPDPMVGGGVMPLTSPLYPREPVDVRRWLRRLPEDGSIPGMPGWRWIHTPGHTEGHISLWRESDRALIAGDAFITTNQESAYAVATQKPEMHGPPMYFTPDWASAGRSVERLAALAPELVVTGHGRAMHGEDMRRKLDLLAREFDRIAVPRRGRYRHTARTVPNERRPGTSILGRLAFGAIAGVAGTLAMTAAMRHLHRALPEEERYPLPPREINDRVFDRGRRETELQHVTVTSHFAFGAVFAAAFAALRQRPTYPEGMAYAVLVWAASYFGWIPLMGILSPAQNHPARRNALMIAVHLVWGAALVATLRELDRAREESFAAGPDRDAPGPARRR